MNDEEMRHLSIEAMLDQAKSMSKLTAELTRTVCLDLISMGFTNDEAFELTKIFFKQFNGSRFHRSRGDG